MVQYTTLDIYGLWQKIEKRKIVLKKIIRRYLLESLVKRIAKPYIEIIFGPRQSGKTTLLFLLIDYLLKNKNSKDNILYINLDTISNYTLFENPMVFIESISSIISPKKKVYIFIDEIQRLNNAGGFLKGVYDLKKNIKLFVSGSSSLELRKKTHEFMTGRKRETFLLPLSFCEIAVHSGKIPEKILLPLNSRTIKKYIENEKIYNKFLVGLMENLAVYGSYPEVVMEKDSSRKLEILNELFNTYIRKDITDFIKIKRISAYNNLIKVLSAQTGNLINKSEIGSNINLNTITLTDYLTILSDTFVTHYLPPLTGNRRNEVKSAHKCYFFDNGFRNFALRMFSDIDFRTDKGVLYENIVFNELYKNLTFEQELFFWRTKAGSEVDFVLSAGDRIIPIEVKTGKIKSGMLSKSYHSFIEKYKPKTGIFLNRNLFDFKIINKCRIYYIPIHWFLLGNKKIIGGIINS